MLYSVQCAWGRGKVAGQQATPPPLAPTHLVLSSIWMRMTRGHLGSSSGLWNWLTYGCRSASCAVMRLLGLNCRHTRSRSNASALAVGNISESALGRDWGSDSSIVDANGDRTDAVSSADGRPVTSRMRSNWFMVDTPVRAAQQTVA